MLGRPVFASSPMPMIPDDTKPGEESGDRTTSGLAGLKRLGITKPLIALFAAIGAGFLVRRFKRSKDETANAETENNR
jgi:hypothetical protein